MVAIFPSALLYFVFIFWALSLLSLGFVEAFQSEILRTLRELVKLFKTLMDECYNDETKPRYLQLCERLKLSTKVRNYMESVID